MIILREELYSLVWQSDAAPGSPDLPLRHGMQAHHKLTLLAPVGEVVVPRAHVVGHPGLCDLARAEVKVCASIVQLRHLSSKLAWEWDGELNYLYWANMVVKTHYFEFLVPKWQHYNCIMGQTEKITNDIIRQYFA